MTTVTLTQASISWGEQLQQIAPLIGNTPLLPITRAWPNPRVKVFAKLEWQQFGQSVKARPAFGIIQDAVAREALRPGMALLDATSGNTGIAYASIGAAAGIPVSLVVPANISQARRQILHALGATLHFSSPLEGTDGAQQMARELHAAAPGRYFLADQYSNPANFHAHIQGTAREIWAQTQGQVTHFVAGLGTTGSFTGTTLGLRELNPGIKAIELQPSLAMHALEGWKHLETAVVPKIYQSHLADERLEISTEEAFHWVKSFASSSGFLISPSAAANLAGAIRVAQGLESGVVVTLFPDNGDKYSEVNQEIF